MDGYFIKKIGNHRGKPRVWLDRLQTEKAGFMPGSKYDLEIQGKTIVLKALADGSRVVTPKKDGDRVNPIIDLNGRELQELFEGMASIRVVVRKGEIYLLPLATEIKKQDRVRRLKNKLESGEALDIGSISHGGGIMAHAIHAGLGEAGYKTRLSFVNEIRENLLEHAAIHNDAWSDDTKIFSAPMQELAFDSKGLSHVPAVDIFEGGIPCSGASKAGRSKRGLKNPESHPEVGHLVVAALVILNKANPCIAIFENVPSYSASASADILRNQLRDMGYRTEERLLKGADWGVNENRTRWFLIAVTEGIEFSFDSLIPPENQIRKIKEVLDPAIGPNDPRWRPYAYLKEKQERDIADGDGFMMQIVTEDDEIVPTLRKGYQKGGSTDPLLLAPHDASLYRQFTPEEHARLRGAPEHLIEGVSATIGHEILGQSVSYPIVTDIGEHLGNALNRLSNKPETNLARRKPQDAIDIAEFKDDSLTDDIVDLGREVVATLKPADLSKGRYSGRIVAFDDAAFIQDIGKNEGVVHFRTNISHAPKLGEQVKVVYDKGHGQVSEKTKPQLALEM